MTPGPVQPVQGVLVRIVPFYLLLFICVTWLLFLRIGQQLKGKSGIYHVSEKIHQCIWSAVERSMGKVITKTAFPLRLKNECDMLKRFNDQPAIRPLLDEIVDPPCIVLKHLDDNLLNASNRKPLEKAEIKLVARKVLEALKPLHEAGYVHTDVKPENILVNYGDQSSRFKEIMLGDCGDIYHIPSDRVYSVPSMDDPDEERPIIGAAIFRSPEANFCLRWGTATDIRSPGATLISLIWAKNWHIFKPTGNAAKYDPEDPEYPIHVVFRQVGFFGPIPKKYHEIVDAETSENLPIFAQYVEENGLRKPFMMLEDPEVTQEDKIFISKLM